MIYLKLKIDNFYMFKETQFDFTYPKKTTNSTIKGEFLTEFPKINYKKVCILMGANASGKTSLGKVMCSINNYLWGRSVEGIPETMCNKDENASIKMIYVTPETKEIHKLIVVFNKDGLIKESHQVQPLKKTYNLEKTLETLENSVPQFIYNQEKN
ncbi:MAG: hypothetical protein PSN35_04180, partial [Candidatus Thioglobus sp.]|nr:hypothetical protein [Candidatus Thioglobus sp.]